METRQRETVSIISFTDSMSNSIAKLVELKDATGRIGFEVEWQMPGRATRETASFGKFEYAEASEFYHSKFDAVIAAAERWREQSKKD